MGLRTEKSFDKDAACFAIPSSIQAYARARVYEIFISLVRVNNLVGSKTVNNILNLRTRCSAFS